MTFIVLHFLALIFSITAVVMLVISWFKPASTVFEDRDRRVVDMTPWKPVKIVSAFVVIATLTFYIGLAQ